MCSQEMCSKEIDSPTFSDIGTCLQEGTCWVLNKYPRSEWNEQKNLLLPIVLCTQQMPMCPSRWMDKGKSKSSGTKISRIHVSLITISFIP